MKSYLNSSDYDWAIGMTRLGLKVCGVWPNIRRAKWLKTLISIRVFVATFIVMIFTIIPGLIALVKVWGNMTLIIDNLIITLPFFTAIFKLNVLWSKEPEVQKLFDDINEDWSRPRNEIERNIMIKTAKIARNVTIFAYILVIWVILIHHLPLWVAGVVPRTPTNLTDGSRALVMQTIYFYDETVSPIFEITAIGQFMSSLVAGSSYTTIDCVFGALILHVSGQLQVLEIRVQNLCNHYDKSTQYVDKVLFQRDLNSVARAHQRAISFVERMESIFCMMLLEQFTAFAIIFATEGFNVISVITGDVEGSFSTMSFSISYFIYALFLIFLYSAAGEYLIENSCKIYHAAYNSQWPNLEKRDMYQIIMIINRSQKPLIVTAGKFAPISLSTFAKLIKTSAGYMSVLLAVRT